MADEIETELLSAAGAGEEDMPLEAESSEPRLDGLSGEEGDEEQLSGRGGELDSELATGSVTGGGEGGGEDNLLDHLSNSSDGGWDTDIDTEEEKEEYDATGRAAYQHCCKMLGIIPISHLLADLENNVTHINLSHHGLGAKGAKSIAAALATNTFVTHLDLSDCGLGPEGAVAITTMFKENCYITHLELSDNQIQAAGALGVAGMLESNSTLTHLSLRGSEFNDKAAEPISEVIKTSYQLSYLDLSHNQFGESAGVLLGEAIGESEVLTTLNLSWNYIRKKGAVALAKGLKVNQLLQILDLSNNGLGDEGAVALVDALKSNTTITELDISGNRFSSSTATLFATKVLPVTESLTILRMGKNSMQKVICPKEDRSQLPEPAIEVAVLLDAAAACSTLQTLDLSGVTFTLDMADKVASIRETRPDLTITYGGTGGHTRVKQLTPPLEKLRNYAAEHSLNLEDLFRSFDTDHSGHLSREQFTLSLKHIQAPVLEFERQKLMKQFGKTQQPTEGGGGGEETIIIDYMSIVGAIAGTSS